MLKEFFGHHRAHRVRTCIFGTSVAVAIAIETRERIEAADFQRFSVYVALIHAHQPRTGTGALPGASIILMRHTRVIVLVLTVMLTLGLVSPAQAASTALQDARELRTSVSALMTNYERNYSDRLTSSDQATLKAVRLKANRQLTQLLTDIRRAERTNKRSDWLRAQQTHAQASSEAELGLEQARTILEPRLGLAEKLTAFSDYSTKMEQFRSLGLRLQAQGR